jgi:DNA-binding transcriptional ArsR family regulator
MADNVVILEPGDERAQKISKAMASQTASDILQLLAEDKKSLTEITDRLDIPLTTAKYHIENLLEAGLITVAETKYSVKGREIKIYAITNQLLIVAPRQSNVRSLLLKYASLFGIVLFGSLVIAMLSPILGQGTMTAAGSSLNGATRMAAQESAVTSAKAVTDGLLQNATITPDMTAAAAKGMTDFAATNLTSAPSPLATLVQAPLVTPVPIPPEIGAQAAAVLPDPALVFFLGGLLVILVLVIYEVYLWKKMKS